METDISPEEIQSKLRLLRRFNSQRRPRPLASVERPDASAGTLLPGVIASQSEPLTPDVPQWPLGFATYPTRVATAHVEPTACPPKVAPRISSAPSAPRILRTVSSSASPSPIRTAGAHMLDSPPPRHMSPRSTRGSDAPYASTPEVQSVLSPSGSMPPSPSSASSAARNRDEGVSYLTCEELAPFASPPDDHAVGDVLGRLGASGDWSEQFAAIDDARRLTRFAPRLLASGHLHKLTGLIASLADSLRSTLAKNALRCTGELFVAFGKKMDPDIELCLAATMRRAADTNVFIAEEAEVALRELCRSASEAKLLPQALAAAGHRQPRIRAQAVLCLAMLGQRLRARGPAAQRELRLVAEAAGKLLTDASVDVRQGARAVAIVLSGAVDGPQAARLAAAVPPGLDCGAFDAFAPDSLRRCGDLGRSTALARTPGRVRA